MRMKYTGFYVVYRCLDWYTGECWYTGSSNWYTGTKLAYRFDYGIPRVGSLTMLIHTFEVKSQVTVDEFRAISNSLCKLSDWMPTNRGILYYGYSSCGILVELAAVGKDSYVRCDVVYRITPSRLFDHDDYLGLFDTAYTDRLMKEVDFRLQALCPLLPDMAVCDLTRVDYTVNAVLDSHKQVKTYVDFAKQSRLPKHMKVYAPYDAKSKRHKLPKDGYTVFTAKDYHNVEVTVYDKYRAMVKANGKKVVFPERALKDGKDVLRIEVRLKKHKIYTLAKRHGIYSVRSFLTESDRIIPDVVEHYLSRMIPRETVRTLAEARKIIAESDLDDAKKARLTAFVETVSVKRSTQKAIDAYKAAGDRSKAKKCLKMLAGLDINCVIATEKTMTVFEGHVPTLLELWEQALSGYEWTAGAYVLRIGKRRKARSTI